MRSIEVQQSIDKTESGSLKWHEKSNDKEVKKNEQIENEIGETGAKEISELLKCNWTLRKLNLGSDRKKLSLV